MESQKTKAETKRKHVTTACVACHESKVKCNGAAPTCSSCLSKGKECRYEAREDRRKLSLRIAVELPNNRVQQLSLIIQKHGLQLPSMPPNDDKTLSGSFQASQLPLAPFPVETNCNQATSSDIEGTAREQTALRTTEPSAAIPSTSTDPCSRTHNTDDALATNVTIVSGTAAESLSNITTPVIEGLLELAKVAGNLGGISGAMMTSQPEVAAPVTSNSGAGWEWNIQDSMQPVSVIQPPLHQYQHQHHTPVSMGVRRCTSINGN